MSPESSHANKRSKMTFVEKTLDSTFPYEHLEWKGETMGSVRGLKVETSCKRVLVTRMSTRARSCQSTTQAVWTALLCSYHLHLTLRVSAAEGR